MNERLADSWLTATGLSKKAFVEHAREGIVCVNEGMNVKTGVCFAQAINIVSSGDILDSELLVDEGLPVLVEVSTEFDEILILHVPDLLAH